VAHPGSYDRPMRLRVPLALAAGLAVASCGSDESPVLDVPSTAAPTSTTSTTAVPTSGTVAEPQSITLTLTGDAEVPGPGSTGTAEATLTYDGDQLCVSGTTTGVGAITAAHVHAGAAGESGPPGGPLPVETDGDGPIEGCQVVGAEGGVVFVDPASYYLNLHTAEFPDGAVRAQLG